MKESSSSPVGRRDSRWCRMNISQSFGPKTLDFSTARQRRLNLDVQPLPPSPPERCIARSTRKVKIRSSTTTSPTTSIGLHLKCSELTHSRCPSFSGNPAQLSFSFACSVPPVQERAILVHQDCRWKAKVSQRVEKAWASLSEQGLERELAQA